MSPLQGWGQNSLRFRGISAPAEDVSNLPGFSPTGLQTYWGSDLETAPRCASVAVAGAGLLRNTGAVPCLFRLRACLYLLVLSVPCVPCIPWFHIRFFMESACRPVQLVASHCCFRWREPQRKALSSFQDAQAILIENPFGTADFPYHQTLIPPDPRRHMWVCSHFADAMPCSVSWRPLFLPLSQSAPIATWIHQTLEKAKRIR